VVRIGLRVGKGWDTRRDGLIGAVIGDLQSQRRPLFSCSSVQALAASVPWSVGSL
jgi:hypothetical protein